MLGNFAYFFYRLQIFLNEKCIFQRKAYHSGGEHFRTSGLVFCRSGPGYKLFAKLLADDKIHHQHQYSLSVDPTRLLA